MGRITKLEYESRIADTEEHIVRLRSSPRIIRVMAAKYRVDPKSVANWIREVYDRWAAEATEVNREARRNEMRATLNTVVSMALNKSTVLKDINGNPMIDAVTQKPITRALPDIKSVLDATKQLRALDGLDAPVRVDARLDGDSSLKLDGSSLINALKGITPTPA